MYGDCQVLSTMGLGGNMGGSSDPFFSSPIRSPPNLNFMATIPFHHADHDGVMKGKDEEMDSGSGSGGPTEVAFSDEQENDQPPKKKRYHRHTARQIQEMEALFKECPHPDDKQRTRLSQELGLTPRQVKFWFQNRRTQMKAQQDRSDNVMLRTENESLKTENFRLQATIRNLICPNCGGPAILGEMSFDEQHLRIENARLKDELERLSCLTSRYTNRSLHLMGPTPPLLLPSLDLDMSIYSRALQEVPLAQDVVPGPFMQAGHHNCQPSSMGLMEHEKPMAMELALSALDQLMRMCHSSEPLWFKGGGNGATEMLNVDEYTKTFHWLANMKQQLEFKTEATRDTAVVIMNSITLVDAFLDAHKWTKLFPSIVSKAKTIQVISSGVSGPGNGSLQLMYAELQVLSPLIPTRETYFLRYCQQNVEEGSWALVDFPIDSFHEGLQPPFPRFRRRPSGCIIQDMPNGYSRVTWLEHAEVEEKPVHQILTNYVDSKMAFGAQRWLAVLQRQCERLASLMARNISDLGVIPTPEARKNMMNLAQRMMRTFCVNISSSGNLVWTSLSDSTDDTLRVITRKNTDPGQPHGVILTAVSTTWLPYSAGQVFDLLRDERRRSQLDVLSGGNTLHEVAHIANGSHPGNCISLLRMNSASNSSQNIELMLQESCTDPDILPIAASLASTPLLYPSHLVLVPLARSLFYLVGNMGEAVPQNDNDNQNNLYWYEEEIDEDLKWSFALNSVLHRGSTAFQNIALLDTKHFGKALIIDGKMQSCEWDEFIYHECLVHPAMLLHPNPKNMFIMGGGEGSTAREVLKHKTLDKVVMCDIDQEVVNFCKTHLTINKEAFANEKLQLVINDAKKELQDRQEKFDVIVGDLADPVEGGPCYQLYTKSFYEQVLKPKLSEDGIFITQSGPAGILSHKLVFSSIYNTLKQVFKYVIAYSAHVPAFADTWGWVMASDEPFELDANKLNMKIAERMKGELLYLTGEVFIASTVLNKTVHQSLLNETHEYTEESARYLHGHSLACSQNA